MRVCSIVVLLLALFSGSRAQFEAVELPLRFFDSYVGYLCGCRPLPRPLGHLLDSVGIAVHHRFNGSVAAIAYPAGDAQLHGLLPHRVAEVDALHPAVNDEAFGDDRFAHLS